jgi:indole-3-glycerol phosphate synthase
MATGSLQVNRDIILATKKQQLKIQQQHTPMDAVISMAQMQPRPRGILNYSSDGEKITLIAQLTRREIYDPVTSALHCMFNGADAISFFTDHSIYTNALDDLTLVARAIKNKSVIYQNYVLNEYEVTVARGADASALVVYASLVPKEKLRQIVSMAQRWKMSTLVQVSSEEDIEAALELSPHALCFGDNLSSNINDSVQEILRVHPSLPSHYKIVLMHTLDSLGDVELALSAPIDALIVSQDLLTMERSARELREMIDIAQKERNKNS